MRRLRTWARLQPAERARLLRALWAVTVVRLALWLMPLDRLIHEVDRACRRFGRLRRVHLTLDQAADAVLRASNHVPGAKKCLCRALALRLVLASAGHASELKLGAIRSPTGVLQAHAWVECKGRALLPDGDVARLRPLRPPIRSVRHAATSSPRHLAASCSMEERALVRAPAPGTQASDVPGEGAD